MAKDGKTNQLSKKYTSHDSIFKTISRLFHVPDLAKIGEPNFSLVGFPIIFLSGDIR